MSTSTATNNLSSTLGKRKLVEYASEAEDEDDDDEQTDEQTDGPEGKDEEDSSLHDSTKRKRTQKEYEEDDGVKKVYVWDLDETLIIFQSLLTGKLVMYSKLRIVAL